MIKACLFALDGVLVDTTRYHSLAWKRLAAELGFELTDMQCESLRGASRSEALTVLLRAGGLDGRFDTAQKNEIAGRKDALYAGYISRMTSDEILPGVIPFLSELRREGVAVALSSTCRSASAVVDRLGIRLLFDSIVDGLQVSRAEPDPEAFLRSALILGADLSGCVVFSNTRAGIEAASCAGMRSVGVGDPDALSEASIVVGSFDGFTVDDLRWLIREQLKKCV